MARTSQGKSKDSSAGAGSKQHAGTVSDAEQNLPVSEDRAPPVVETGAADGDLSSTPAAAEYAVVEHVPTEHAPAEQVSTEHVTASELAASPPRANGHAYPAAAVLAQIALEGLSGDVADVRLQHSDDGLISHAPVRANGGDSLISEESRPNQKPHQIMTEAPPNGSLIDFDNRRRLAATQNVPAQSSVFSEPTAALSARAGFQAGSSLAIDLSSERAGTVRTMARSARSGTKILFDISDLVYYIGHHPNLTGIQRVQSSIVLTVIRDGLIAEQNLLLLSFNARTRSWVSIPLAFMHSLLEGLFLPEPHRSVVFNPEEARYGVLPASIDFDGSGVLDDGHPSVLCLLGAAWVNPDYMHRVLTLKRRFGTRFVMTVHDLIPIYAPETCDQDTVRVFEDFMRRALPHVDHTLSVSQNTASDLERYTQSLGIPTPPITVTRNGSSFAEFLADDAALGELHETDLPDRFVLFVATIEGRKNHQLILEIWRRMIEDGEDPPHLVCVGRLGWKSSAFISALVESDYLDGRVHLLRDISDTDLRLLYMKCLFTVCPTFYEGWGLPVGESLAMGKICVASNRASIPEVAGDFAVYIDIDDPDAARHTITELIADAGRRRQLERGISAGYQPITWRSVAERVVEACLAARRAKWPEPYPHPAIPYSTEISFGRLNPSNDAIGERLLERIVGPRKGILLADPLQEQNFRLGEESRAGGSWAQPEDWGTWACLAGGEVTFGLTPNPSTVYFVFLRLRVPGLLADHPVRVSANGEALWQGPIGHGSRTVALRVRRRVTGQNGWRLRLTAQITLSPELLNEIAKLDGRIPAIGFERLVVVPDNDLKTRLDVLYQMETANGTLI